MSKELSSLDAFYELMDVYFDNDIVKAKYGITIESAKERYEIIETALKQEQNELKAFKIIKEKMVDVVYLYSSCYELEHYNEYAPFEIEEKDKLTQEEFDLLKEVLK